ncbi:MAG: hypothetical protein HY812_10280 [Planctomycetes bacterium]|nr:hypothetical protein [Planctomycetota bacterium]
MLRADAVSEAVTRARTDERVLVRPGEVKVSCGEHVVFQTTPLEKGFALAVYDGKAHVGGVMAAAPMAAPGSQEAGEACLNPVVALPLLVESIIRMGADRCRLSFAAAGDAGFLALVNPALADLSAGAKPRRRARQRRPTVLVLDLGSGLARTEDAAEEEAAE